MKPERAGETSKRNGNNRKRGEKRRRRRRRRRRTTRRTRTRRRRTTTRRTRNKKERRGKLGSAARQCVNCGDIDRQEWRGAASSSALFLRAPRCRFTCRFNCPFTQRPGGQVRCFGGIASLNRQRTNCSGGRIEPCAEHTQKKGWLTRLASTTRALRKPPGTSHKERPRGDVRASLPSPRTERNRLRRPQVCVARQAIQPSVFCSRDKYNSYLIIPSIFRWRVLSENRDRNTSSCVYLADFLSLPSDFCSHQNQGAAALKKTLSQHQNSIREQPPRTTPEHATKRKPTWIQRTAWLAASTLFSRPGAPLTSCAPPSCGPEPPRRTPPRPQSRPRVRRRPSCAGCPPPSGRPACGNPWPPPRPRPRPRRPSCPP